MDSENFDESCGFCAEIHGIRTENNLLYSIITPQTELESRVLAETEHFIVIPTIGAFVDGYVMIVTKEHYECIGKMPAEAIGELEQLISRIKKCIRETYQMDTVCFEHGGVSCAKRAGGCIVHAHLHLVPCDSPIIDEVRDRGFTADSISGLSSLQKYGKDNLPYLYFEDTDGQKYIVRERFVISQFFRQLLAHHFGLDSQWDWRQHFFLDNMVKIVERMPKI